MTELAKAYEPKGVEDREYARAREEIAEQFEVTEGSTVAPAGRRRRLLDRGSEQNR